jgi:hypothetical protein
MCQFAFLKSLKTVQSRSRTPLTAIALIAGSLLPLQVTEPVFQRKSREMYLIWMWMGFPGRVIYSGRRGLICISLFLSKDAETGLIVFIERGPFKFQNLLLLLLLQYLSIGTTFAPP